MAKSNYQYETSPRKIEPEYSPQKKKTKKQKNIQITKKELEQKKIELNE